MLHVCVRKFDVMDTAQIFLELNAAQKLSHRKNLERSFHIASGELVERMNCSGEHFFFKEKIESFLEGKGK